MTEKMTANRPDDLEAAILELKRERAP